MSCNTCVHVLLSNKSSVETFQSYSISDVSFANSDCFVFIISAVTLLILMIPGFVTSCYTCCFLKKQHRRKEEDDAIAQVSDPHGQIVKPGAHHQQQMAAHQGGWQYPFYGWPSSYYGQGR